MFYAIYVPPYREGEEEKPEADGLVFEDIKEANAALKRYKGSRMKIFPSRERALYFLQNPDTEESFLDLDSSCHDMVTSFEKLSVNQHSSPKSPAANNMTTGASLFASPIPPAVQQQKVASTPDDAEPAYPSAKPGMLNQLRRKIENGDYEAVEETIWSNPRCLVSVCDSAIYLMAGPKYNACHIAARANKPDIMALLLDTISNFSFLRKLYPNESDLSLQDRVNHLLDSYLNTPDPRQGNTPLHFACKLGYYRVVRVLLTFEGCDLTLTDSNGQTAEESICSQYKPPPVCMADQFKEKLNIHESGEHRQADGDGDGGGATIREPVVNSETQLNNVKQKIKNMFKQQFHLPLYRDQLKKRLILERRRSRASSQMDSDTSFSDIDDSFIISSPTKQNK
uniref:Ankyrin repeat and LEM domain-containing protein 2 n=1 Tax=Aceria tosichella TaxID=561515 RepID=A0A6G1SNV0_9ACAR